MTDNHGHPDNEPLVSGNPDCILTAIGGGARGLLDAFPDAVVCVDQGGTIREVNERAARQLEKGPEELIGTAFESYAPKGIAKARKAFIDGVFQTGKALRFEEERDGRWRENIVSPLTDREGRPRLAVFIARDITSRKKAEEKARLSERQMSQAAKMVSLGTLVSGVAHEINNPNNFIMMNTPLLYRSWEEIEPVLERHYRENGDFQMGGLPYSEMRQNIPVLFEGIREGAKRIERIISSLKNFARPDADNTTEPVNVNDVVQSAVSLLEHFIRKSSCRFSLICGTELPPLQGNAQKLEQVVINLVQNACQALPDADRAVTVATAFDERRKVVVLTVADEGRGIETDLIQKIMEPFYTTRRKSGGTGLGLSIVSRIVKEHGGDISVRSRVGEGSTFTVSLPLWSVVPKTRILVVDDEAPLRKVVVKVLQKQRSYVVREAKNGLEACIKLGTFKPDVLVLDINMPEMDGCEVCRWIRSEPAHASTEVIVVTGYPDSDKLREIREMGFVNVLYKPFKAEELAGMVRQVLER